jgi:hypothetical protein
VVRPTPVPPLAYNVADRRRLPPPRRPLPLLDTDLDLDLECVLPLLLEVLCLDLLSSRRSRALCKPLLPGRSSHLCLRRSPRETLRLCSALHVDVVDKSAQNLPTADIGAVSVVCTLLHVGADAKSACARSELSSYPAVLWPRSGAVGVGACATATPMTDTEVVPPFKNFNASDQAELRPNPCRTRHKPGPWCTQLQILDPHVKISKFKISITF